MAKAIYYTTTRSKYPPASSARSGFFFKKWKRAVHFRLWRGRLRRGLLLTWNLDLGCLTINIFKLKNPSASPTDRNLSMEFSSFLRYRLPPFSHGCCCKATKTTELEEEHFLCHGLIWQCRCRGTSILQCFNF